ncbi:hypothetical protein BH20ACT3_BH20ACT3_03310 [soil metagenome]
MTLELLAIMSWDPGFKGILTVAVGVGVLCGAAALILGTNNGARLGFLIALSGLFGWNMVMGGVWAAYGTGWTGPDPTWEVVDTTIGPPEASPIEVVGDLVLPEDLPDPVAERDRSEQLLEEFPPEEADPSLTDLVTVDEDLATAIDDQIDPWSILPTSDGYFGETESSVDDQVGTGEVFADPTDYIVLETFVTGGKTGRTDDSTIGRIVYTFTSAVEFNNPPLYAAVQLQPVVPQEARPGEAPPLPVPEPDAPIYTVVLERDRGALRLPALTFTAANGLLFALTCNSLHRRDKLATAQRAAARVGAG